jgi:hypothetical protein
MMRDIPLPAGCANIWLTGTTLWLGLPGLGPQEQGHALHFSADTYGLQCAMLVLRERAKAAGRIGTPSAPVQSTVDAMAQALKQRRDPAVSLGAKIIRNGKAYTQAEIDEAEDFLKEFDL